MSLKGASRSTKILIVSQQTNSICSQNSFSISCLDIAMISDDSLSPLAIRWWKYRPSASSSPSMNTFPSSQNAPISSSASPSAQLFRSNLNPNAFASPTLPFARNSLPTHLYSCSSSLRSQRRQGGPRSLNPFRARSRQQRASELLPYSKSRKPANAATRQLRVAEPEARARSPKAPTPYSARPQQQSSSLRRSLTAKMLLRRAGPSLRGLVRMALSTYCAMRSAQSEEPSLASLVRERRAVERSRRLRVRLVESLRVMRESSQGGGLRSGRREEDSTNWLMRKVAHFSSFPSVDYRFDLRRRMEGTGYNRKAATIQQRGKEERQTQDREPSRMKERRTFKRSRAVSQLPINFCRIPKHPKRHGSQSIAYSSHLGSCCYVCDVMISMQLELGDDLDGIIQVMSERMEGVEPLQLKSQRQPQQPREEYARIIDKLENKIKRPLKDLRLLIENEIERLKSQE